MNTLRWATSEEDAARTCSRCAADGSRWDRIAGSSYCPQCEELLVLGEAAPLIERTHPERCAVCHRVGTLTYVSFPLMGSAPVAVELCAEHLRALLGRRLGTYAYHQLARQLIGLGLSPEDVFLLHGAFYDCAGRALQPAGGE